MPISFNEIPGNIRIPMFSIEFDSTMAISGPQTQIYKALLLGQMTTDGIADPAAPVRVQGEKRGQELFGVGSMLASMCETYFKNNKTTETWAIPLEDAGAGVAASGKFAITGAATAAGAMNLYIGGQRARCSVAPEDTAAAVATVLREVINDDDLMPVAATGTDGDVIVTAKNKGEEGNYIDLRVNYYWGEKIPEGLACTITDMASGAGNPDVQDAIDVLGDEQWNVIINPFNDSANLIVIDEELEDRWGPLSQKDGHSFGALNMAYTDLAEFGEALNSKQLTFVGCTKYPTLPWQIAAAVGGVAAYYAPIDPARPFQTLALDGVLPPALGERLTFTERNTLLFSGISSTAIDAGGKVRVERLITTYRTNAAGADDTAFLDVEPKYTLSYLRWDFRNHMMRKYPRHKLANDGTRFGPGQAIITPKIGKGEAVSKFRQWESMGLVEDADQFKRDLIVERNASNPCRLDFLLPVNLINQFRFGAGQIQFLL